jgi:hypothetical protein
MNGARHDDRGCAEHLPLPEAPDNVEIRAVTAAEPTTQIDDGDGIDNVFPSPISDPDGIGKTHPLRLSA